MRRISEMLIVGNQIKSQVPNAETGQPISEKTTPMRARVPGEELELTYSLDPTVFNGINKIVQTIMSVDHEVVAKTKKVQNYFDDFIENLGNSGSDITWEELQTDIYKFKCIYGWSFVENIYNKSGNRIVDWDIIDPKKMDYAKDGNSQIVMDKFGKPVGYTETLPITCSVTQKVPVPNPVSMPFNGIYLPRNRVATFKYMTVGDGFYPIGLIEPIYKTSLRKMNIEEALANAIYRHGFPIIWAKVGDSVLGTRVTIVKIDNEVKILSFEELYDMIDTAEEVNGHILIKKIANVYTLSTNSHKEVSWKKVMAISKHKYSNELVMLQQKVGETIVTDQHSVYNENMELKKAGENPTLFAYRGKVSGFELVDKVVLPNNGDIFTTKYSVPRKDEVTELIGDSLSGFCKLLGAYISEGHSSYHRCGNKDSYQITISQKDKSWLEDLKLITDKIFGLNGYIQNVNGYHRLRYSSRVLYTILTQMCNSLAENKELPSFVFGLSDANKQILLDSLIDGDGYRTGLHKEGVRFSEQYNSKQFEYTTISPKLAAGISLLLNTMGIDYSIRYKQTQGGYTAYTFRRVQRPRCNTNRKHFSKLNFDGFVYDLEVEDNHNFFDGIGMVLCHNTNHEPTPQHIQSMLTKLKDINYKQEIATPYWYDLNVLESKKAEKLREHLEYFKDQEVAGLGIPMPFATGGGADTNRSTLGDQSSLFQLTLRELMNSTMADVRRYLFAPICKLEGFKEVPVIHTDLVGTEELDKKADRIEKYLKAGVTLDMDAIKDYIMRAEKFKDITK